MIFRFFWRGKKRICELKEIRRLAGGDIEKHCKGLLGTFYLKFKLAAPRGCAKIVT